MVEIREIMYFLKLLKDYQPIHAYGLAARIGKSASVSWVWYWLHYLENLGLAKKKNSDKRRTGRKEFVLTDNGIQLLTIMQDVFGRGEASTSITRFRSKGRK